MVTSVSLCVISVACRSVLVCTYVYSNSVYVSLAAIMFVLNVSKLTLLYTVKLISIWTMTHSFYLNEILFK